MDQCTHEIRAEYWKKIIHVGYFFIFQDITFRAVGIIMGIVLYLIARFQHRYNMPSFRDPQFERIRKYLENDELQIANAAQASGKDKGRLLPFGMLNGNIKISYEKCRFLY